MSVYNVLDNPKFVALSLVDMINDERKRIVASGLASKEDVGLVFGPLSAGVIKVAQANMDWRPVVTTLSQVHDILGEIKLPGDFVRLAADALMLDLGNLPKLEDEEYEKKFYDLSGIIEKLKGMRPAAEIEVLPEPTHEHEHTHEDLIDDDYSKIAQIDLAEQVATHLEKIAYTLGRDGNHSAAYLVERTIRELQN